MLWFWRSSRQPAEAIAEHLFRTLIEEAEDDPERFRVRVPTMIRPQFRAKARLYREATVLMLLLARARKERPYQGVLKSFEQMILPGTQTENATGKREALKAAVLDMNELMSAEAKRVAPSWSRAWLQDIGHAETNPATLAQFAMLWVDYSKSIGKALRKLRPA